MKTLVLGMGNSLASDDAVGIIIAERLQGLITQNQDITVTTTECGGFAFIEIMQGFDRAILIDAIKTGCHKPGTILSFKPEDFDCTIRSAFVHGVSFFQALELGRRMKIKLPNQIEIIAVEIINNTTISDQLSKEVDSAIEEVIKVIYLKLGIGSN